ncbi:acylneuraminate cytidylyltransferase family protein [Metabacillus sp. FJAT-52054]|uniref:Acylneuraminate cytidylyltransferase family protein n=1 Tax=Metabacillus sediminis TaxID=3117746 RepID=A0ABZ2NG55_9BACI
MIQTKKVLAIIPARGGSKGVPRKNIRPLAGKPLIAWSIEEAKKSKYIDFLMLSSEDDEIIESARQYGCNVPFKRPKELADDETPGIDPILHAIEQLPEYDLVVVLQPTSPMRSVNDIDQCIEQVIAKCAPACVSVTEPDKSPYWMYTINDGGLMKPLIPQDSQTVRRQDLPNVYALNGAVYVAEIKWLRQCKSFLSDKTIAYNMSKNRSVDIDTLEDFEYCRYLLQKS